MEQESQGIEDPQIKSQVLWRQERHRYGGIGSLDLTLIPKLSFVQSEFRLSVLSFIFYHFIKPALFRFLTSLSLCLCPTITFLVLLAHLHNGRLSFPS